MSSHLIRAETLLAIELLAFWPVWRWYVHRLSDQSDEAWGIVALITAALFVFLQGHSGRNERHPERPKFNHEETKSGKKNIKNLRALPFFVVEFLKRPESGSDAAESQQGPVGQRLMLPAILLLCYTLSYHFLSPLPRAVIAVTAIAATISVVCFGKRLHLGVWGLLLLALPVIASLQFYLGFPMRAIVAKLAAPMLQINGFAVVAEGASLNWNGDSILIDAPCSGVKMLWTGFYLTCALACYYKLNAKRTALACVATFGAIIIGNTFRAATLFYVEAGAANLSLPDWTHEGVGVVVFAATAIAIAWMTQRIATTDLKYGVSFFPAVHHLLPAGRRRAFHADAIGRGE